MRGRFKPSEKVFQIEKCWRVLIRHADHTSFKKINDAFDERRRITCFSICPWRMTRKARGEILKFVGVFSYVMLNLFQHLSAENDKKGSQ